MHLWHALSSFFIINSLIDLLGPGIAFECEIYEPYLFGTLKGYNLT